MEHIALQKQQFFGIQNKSEAKQQKILCQYPEATKTCYFNSIIISIIRNTQTSSVDIGTKTLYRKWRKIKRFPFVVVLVPILRKLLQKDRQSEKKKPPETRHFNVSHNFLASFQIIEIEKRMSELARKSAKRILFSIPKVMNFLFSSSRLEKLVRSRVLVRWELGVIEELFLSIFQDYFT